MRDCTPRPAVYGRGASWISVWEGSPRHPKTDPALYEELKYNLSYRWFLDMGLLECSLDAMVFTKNRQRLLSV